MEVHVKRCRQPLIQRSGKLQVSARVVVSSRFNGIASWVQQSTQPPTRPRFRPLNRLAVRFIKATTSRTVRELLKACTVSRQARALRPKPLQASPTAHSGSKVRSTRALPARQLPPSGFDHPLGGFLPSNPCPPYCRQAALMGLSLRRFPLSRSSQASRPSLTRPPFAPRKTAEQAPRTSSAVGLRVLTLAGARFPAGEG